MKANQQNMSTSYVINKAWPLIKAKEYLILYQSNLRTWRMITFIYNKKQKIEI